MNFILSAITSYVGAAMLLFGNNDWYGAMGWFIAGSYMLFELSR